MSKGARVLSILVAALAAIAFGGSPSLADIAGGGKAKSDCYAVFEGLEATRGKIRVDCMDGDPTCDSDGECQGSCTFSLQVCVNSDRVPGCTSPGVSGYQKNQVKGKNVSPSALNVPAATADPNVCADATDVVVGIKPKKNGSLARKGRANVKLITNAAPEGKPARDPDKLQLLCLRRDGACPPQPETTTTTSTVVTTTTSTIDPAILCCEVPGSSPPVTASYTAIVTSNATGDCGDIIDFTGAVSADVECRGLYFGGGGNAVPLPATIPDGEQTVSAITSCSGQTATLGPATSTDTGSNRNCSAVGCLFGVPLAIPNADNPPVSTCVINTIATAISGTLNCATGSADVSAPLTSEVFLTGDLLAATTGIQPCPLCTGSVCDGGPNDGQACTAGTTAFNEAYPTSHDCPPEPSLNLGGLPIGFDFTTGTVTWTAAPSGTQARVFSGFCRDADFSGAFANPAVPCFENGVTLATCPNVALTDPESCEQRNPGAFGPAGGARMTITAIGTPAGNLTAPGTHTGVLVSVFSIPPTFGPSVDAAADLPGPGATAFPGTSVLCETATACP